MVMGGFTRRWGGFGVREYFPAGVKWLLIANIAVFFLVFFIGLFDAGAVRWLLAVAGLHSGRFLRGMFWQPFTYMFLHGGGVHIVLNMLALWMFGADLERDWGTRRFVRYYFLCGVGAGLCDVAVNVALDRGGSTTIGSSGAIYGILLAYGVLYPTRTILWNFLFPIQARYFVLIVGVFAFMGSVDSNSGVSNVAHLGGMLFGYLYLRIRRQRPIVRWSVSSYYQQWKRRRAQKKFEVYMRKLEREQDHDRWVN